MNKAKLSSRQARVLEDRIDHRLESNEEILRHYFSDCTSVFFQTFPDCDQLITALYIGYEIELTKEEKVKKYYDCYFPHSSGHKAVLDILDILEMKIKGVND